MSLNLYAPCPCGSGKKLKFCCGDLAADIEKIHRMLEGDQQHAALRHVEQSLEKAPDRASLLNLKAMIEMSLRDFQSAAATVERFLAAHPNNAIALANQALIFTQSQGGAAAVMPLQKALALSAGNVPRRVADAVGAVGHALLVAGHVISAQAHLWLYQAMRAGDSRALELLTELYQSSGLPVLLRDPLALKEWPGDAPWRAEAERATELSHQGRWYEATVVIDRLGQQHGPVPTLVFNRAVLGGWLADDRALVAGLHAYAQLDVPRDSAVEAEAIAQLLDPSVSDPPVDTVKLTFTVHDLDVLASRLDESPQLEFYDFDTEPFHPQGGPRPRNSFLMFDRDPPVDPRELTREEVPHVIGFVALFGRQTDRPERLEFTTDRSPDFQANIDRLRAMGGDALGEQANEQVVGHVTEAELALSWRWQFPEKTPHELRRRLLAEERRVAIVERWPDVPRAVLTGKTPRQAASDPALAIPLAALVLILETGANNDKHSDAIGELRRQLGLGQSEPIHPNDEELGKVSLASASRVDLGAVSDDALRDFFQRAVMTNVAVAIRRAAREILNRPSMADVIPPVEAYRRLIFAENDPAVALELIEEARAWSEAAGSSTAPWDILELETHLFNSNVAEIKRSLQRIDERHRDNPEVAAAVYRMLYEAGLIQPEDLTGQHPIPEVIEEFPEDEAPSQESRIWTPGDDLASVAGQKKSQLWTPS